MANEYDEKVSKAWIDLHRAQRKLLTMVESELKEHGLPGLDWYDVLLELQREKKNGLRQYEIGDKILLNKHNLSRLIDRLEKQKLLTRLSCTEDARGYRIKISAEGEKMIKKMWPVYRRAIVENFGNKLNTNELGALAKILGKII